VTVWVRLLRERGPAQGRRAYPERCWPVLRINPGRAGTARSTSTGKVTLACPRARQDKGAAGGLPLALAHSLPVVGGTGEVRCGHGVRRCEAVAVQAGANLSLRPCHGTPRISNEARVFQRHAKPNPMQWPVGAALAETTLSTPPLPSHGGTHGRSMRCGACEPTTTIRQVRRVARQGCEDRLRCGQPAAVGAARDRPLHFVLPEPHA
jgi:hypothetical protein